MMEVSIPIDFGQLRAGLFTGSLYSVVQSPYNAKHEHPDPNYRLKTSDSKATPKGALRLFLYPEQ
jgi:hypothetical protein